MPLFEIAKAIVLVALITATIWAIGRRGGLEIADVFGTLFTNKSRHVEPRGVQEDDDAWEHIHRGDDGRAGSPPATHIVDAAPPVPTSSVHRSRR